MQREQCKQRKQRKLAAMARPMLLVARDLWAWRKKERWALVLTGRRSIHRALSRRRSERGDERSTQTRVKIGFIGTNLENFMGVGSDVPGPRDELTMAIATKNASKS
ncbi:MAG: hypothetical protein ACR2PG_03450 [Hyphomicrobiaceae bacterium]